VHSHKIRVDICGINTSQLPVLCRKDKEELFRKILQGDKEARQKYIFCNLRLVLNITKTFANRKESVDDIFQVGCVGLIKAIDNFDITKGVQFSTYAVPTIAGEIKRYLRDNNSVRVSRTLREVAYKSMQTKESLTNQKCKEPTLEEISKESLLSKEDILKALEAIQHPLSLFDTVRNRNGDSVSIIDQIEDHQINASNWLDNLSLSESICKLNDREKLIIYLRFFLDKTQMEIADEIGISQAQISRLERNAIKSMKQNIN
jgi:RNA polymerase sporulation-specific sigma factor